MEYSGAMPPLASMSMVQLEQLCERLYTAQVHGHGCLGKIRAQSRRA
jgi:hypothetical protein